MAAKTPPKTSPKTADVKADDGKEKKIIDPTAQMEAFLKRTEPDHFNLVETPPPLRVSSGSLNLDMEMGGGFTEGAHRLTGGPNLGKTPFALNVVDTFLDEVPNSRAVWCKAEGRFSQQNMARARHPLVFKAADWVVGTILVFKTNIYETWIDLMRSLVTNNPTKCRYAFVTDALDNLVLRNDAVKPIEEGNRVAGAPLLTKQLFQRIGQALNELGHISFFISQVTSEIKLNPYDKTPPRQGSSGGGNSIAHNANETLEFLNWYEGDLILKNPDERLNRITNPALGHVLKIKLQKSSTEKRYVTVEIPIRYGRSKEAAIWREREIADQMLIWKMMTKAGSWFKFSPALLAELAEANLPEIPEQLQGLNAVYEMLETRKDVSDYLFAQFKARLSAM